MDGCERHTLTDRTDSLTGACILRWDAIRMTWRK